MKRSETMAVDGKKLVTYDCYCSGRDIALGVWRRRWAALSRCCSGILMDTRLAEMTFARYGQELVYCRWLRDAIDTNVEVAERDPELQCWLSNKPYTFMNLMRGPTHRTRALRFEIRHRAAVRNPISAGRDSLEMFVAASEERHWHCVAVSAF